MAILKRFIHFKKFSDFNSKKLSANEANTQYTVGVSGDIQDGEPDVLYQSYCWIRDTKQQWTHGQLYDGAISTANVQAVDTSETLDDVDTNTYVKYVAQTLTEEQQFQTRNNIGAFTSYEYYVSNGGILNECQYNIMIKYLFTPFMISSTSITTIPDELLNDTGTNFFADWYWNVMRITGGEPIMTTQWQNNIPYKFKGVVNNKIYVIDFTTKTITPES